MSRSEQIKSLVMESSEGADYGRKFERTKPRILQRVRLVANMFLMMVLVSATTVTSIVTVFQQVDTGYDTKAQIDSSLKSDRSGS